MLRTSRSIALLLKHLILGAASVGPLAVAVGLTSAVLVGCDDESQPEYWVKKLDDPAKRAASIKRLTQFYEDGLTKSNDKRDTPEMKALLDKIVKPMADQYVKGDLDEKTRVELLKALANTRDPAAKDAIIKAINDFAAGKATAEEMTQSAIYVKQLKLKEAAGPLFEAFLKVKVSDKASGPPYLAVKDAMQAIPDPSWKPKLLELINRPIDPKDVQNGRNEVYWQTVAADLLGELQVAEAVRPLFKIVLLPEKKDMASTAVVALIKIGKPAVVPILTILAGQDPDMVALAEKNGGDAGKNAYVSTAALVLGAIGRSDATTPMIAALGTATDDTTRAVLGREMSHLPASAPGIAALESAFDKVDVSALVPPGIPARIVLAEAAGSFMDSSVVPWLLKEVAGLQSAKGAKEDIDNIQDTLLQTAIKLMKKDQSDDVKKLVDKEGTSVEQGMWKQANDLLTACTDNIGCYLGKLEDPASQEKANQFTGIKSGYMLAMLGNASTKEEIIKRLPKVKNAAVRFVAVNAIDHLSPTGDAKAADELQQIVDANAARGDSNAMQGDAPIKQIIPRLRARAS